MFALRTNELCHGLAALLRDTHTFSMEPVVAQVATDVELSLVVRRPAHTIQLLLLVPRLAGRRAVLVVVLAPVALGTGRTAGRIGWLVGRWVAGRGGELVLGSRTGASSAVVGRADLVLLVAFETCAGGKFVGDVLLNKFREEYTHFCQH